MHACNGSLLAFFTLLVLCGCGGGGSSGGGGGDGGEDPPPGGIDPPLALLAGGGRAADSAEPAGGASGSGPASPLFEPYPGPVVLFASDLDCHAAAGEIVLRTTSAWQAWWDVAISCLPFEPFVPPEVDPDPVPPASGGGGDPGSGSSGSGVAVPGDPSIAPEVDFAVDSVVVIALEPALAVGRGLWVSEVVAGAGGATVIRYEVTTPAPDCDPYLGMALDPSAPVIAVLVPGILDGPVVFERTDSSYSCSWAPDPAEPVTLYYTDGDCALGPGREVIRDTATFEAWLNEAQQCDAARWFDPGMSEPSGPGTVEPEPHMGGGGTPGDPGGAGGSGGMTEPGSPGDPGVSTPVPGGWLGLDVDFTTHAVIVLRAGAQMRWGGGVWLNSIDSSAAGTTIEYTVMAPGALCPEVEPGMMLRPSVAIRMPLPLDEPVVWIEHIDSISCDWGEPVPSGAPGTTTVDSPGQ